MKTIYLLGEVGFEITAKNLQKEMPKDGIEKLRIIIDSPGGSVSEGIRIYNLLKSYKGEIEFIIGSMAASSASYIAMAVPKENRKAFKNSSMMFHEASSGMYGRARDFKIVYDRLTGVNNIIAESYSENMGIKKSEAVKMMSEDYFVTGWEKLLEHNLISDIIDPSEIDFPEPLKGNSYFDMFFGKLEKENDRNSIVELMYQAEEHALEDWKKNNTEFEQIAAILKIEPEAKIEEQKTEPIAQIPALAGNNKTGGVKIMNLDELKAQHPALYNELFALGKKAGKEEMSVNITAHAKWFEADPKAVMENISKGEEFTMAHLSAYTQSAMTVKAVADRLADNPDDVKKSDDKASADKKEEMIQAEMNRMLGLEV